MVTFIVWIVFINFEQKRNLNQIETVFNNKEFCKVVIPSEDSKILEFH